MFHFIASALSPLSIQPCFFFCVRWSNKGVFLALCHISLDMHALTLYWRMCRASGSAQLLPPALRPDRRQFSPQDATSIRRPCRPLIRRKFLGKEQIQFRSGTAWLSCGATTRKFTSLLEAVTNVAKFQANEREVMRRARWLDGGWAYLWACGPGQALWVASSPWRWLDPIGTGGLWSELLRITRELGSLLAC